MEQNGAREFIVAALEDVMGVEVSSADLPHNFQLSANYPNPFNSSTVITYVLPSEGRVRLAIYDSGGREVKRLVEGVIPSGRHYYNANLNSLSSGTYFYSLKWNEQYELTRKMVIVR